ncbi:alpha/beta-hydrolase [Microthyrium microscopicum]|uniref:Carboxylic ester hydrolase n=1 Tax=Microthyrium microscopicum TaxID=703497 RepID=A0A6A6URQ0_9PEZI|nr:alpha/beta-hydrolase [Microthyrium microscopicum]
MPNYLLLSLLSFITVQAQSTFRAGQTVKTTSGDITGQPSSWKPEVSEYLGIPYAEPPVGKLRWAAPVAAKGSGKAINATKYGFSCSTANNSPASAAMGGATDTQKEDCLFLNLWTKPQTGEKKKAVMVWIYGGAFIVGSGSNKGYNGALLADEHDVIVVNLNYRISVFGFPGMSFLPDKNVGLLDQRMALEWVRDNIEKFGGDPSRITLFGQSAGAASVDYYAYAYTKDPIVNAFIPQSGTSSTMSFSGFGNVSEAWYKASEKLGCGTAADGEKTLDCMRTKSTDDIISVVKPPPSNSSTSALNFGVFLPRVDGKTVFDDYAARTAAGNYIKKPVLIGNVENEMITFIRGNSVSASFKKSLTAVFSCAAATVAKARTTKVPTWRYSYAGDYPNQNTAADVSGPWHGSEIGLIFGTTQFTRKSPDSPEQLQLAKTMREAWTAFAKKPESGLDTLKWPRYDPEKPTIVILGGVNSSAITYKTSAEYDKTCSLSGILSSMFGGLGKGSSTPKRLI